MLIFGALAIGLFFTTCILIVQPLYLFWMLPLLLPFFAGAIIARLLQWRGWFALVSQSGILRFGLVALSGAIALPILIGIAVMQYEARQVALPAGAVALTRSIGPDGFYMTFLTPHSIDQMKVHFRKHHDIQHWRDVPTSDAADDAAPLKQSVSHSLSGALWVPLGTRGDQTFVEVGGPHDKPEPAYVIAAFGFLILVAMIALGPPRSRRV